jgi:hypothetical protein
MIDNGCELLKRHWDSIRRPGEKCRVRFDSDGFGLGIGVVSSRPHALLKEIKDKAFSDFGSFRTDEVIPTVQCHWLPLRAF